MKFFYNLTDEEKMDLYKHNPIIKKHADEMLEYVWENFKKDAVMEDYSISDALEDMATNMMECPEEWLIVVSGCEIVEISESNNGLEIEHYKEG